MFDFMSEVNVLERLNLEYYTTLDNLREELADEPENEPFPEARLVINKLTAKARTNLAMRLLVQNKTLRERNETLQKSNEDLRFKLTRK